MAGRTVDIGFRADISNLTAQLKSLPGLTEGEAKKMAASLERQIKKAEKASVRAAKAAKSAARRANDEMGQTAKSLRGVEEAGGEASSILGGVASALDLVSPEAGAAARALGDLAGGAEMVARSGPSMINILGPVAVAAGIAGLAFKHFSDELAEAEARMVAAANRAAMMTSIFGRIKTEKARLALELAVARGEAQVGDLTRFNAEQKAAAVYEQGRAEATKSLTNATQKRTQATDDLRQMEADLANVTKHYRDESEARAVASGYAQREKAIKAQTALVARLTVTENAAKRVQAGVVEQQAEFADNVEELVNIKLKDIKTSGGSKRSAKEVKTELEKLNEATQAMLPARDISKLQELTEHLDILKAAAEAAGGKLSKELAPAILLVQGAIDKIKADDAADALTEMMEDANRLAPQTVSRLEELEQMQLRVADAIEETGDATGDLQKSYDRLGDAIHDANEERRKSAEAADAAIAKSAKEKAEEQRRAWMDSYSNINEAASQIAAEILSRREEAAQEEIAILSDSVDSREAMLEDERDHRAQLLEEAAERDVSRELAASDAKIAMLSAAAEAEKEALYQKKIAEGEAVREAFNIHKALKISEITMSTASAVISALTVPPPAGFVLAGTVAALGATQAGIVAAQEPPASFHLGGIVGGRPDERTITARAGEGLLTRQGVNAIGGEAGLAAANRGQGGGPMVVQMVYKHKVLDEVLSDSVARGGPIGGAINRRSPRGRRNPHARRAS